MFFFSIILTAIVAIIITSGLRFGLVIYNIVSDLELLAYSSPTEKVRSIRWQCLKVIETTMRKPPILIPNLFHGGCLVVADYIFLAGYALSIFYILIIPVFYLLVSCFC